MAGSSKAKSIITGVALAVGCVAGVVATAYSAAAAYLMGAQAQADLDQTTAADPRLLLRSSFQNIVGMAQTARSATIDVQDDDIEVHTVD